MRFGRLREKVGLSMAIALKWDELKGNAKFWDSLKFTDWLSLYMGGEVPAEAKDMADARLKTMAKTFVEFSQIANCAGKTTLGDWARGQMEQTASTFDEHVSAVREGISCDFARLLGLAKSLKDLAAFCRLVTYEVLDCNERHRCIDSALCKMSAVDDAPCEEWISVYECAAHEEVRQLALSRIKAFKLSARAWLSHFSYYGDIGNLICELAVSSVESFQDCKLVHENFFVEELVDRAAEFAKTFEEWNWVAGKELSPGAVEEMAKLAKTFDEWRLVHIRAHAAECSSIRQLAFNKMKELAA